MMRRFNFVATFTLWLLAGLWFIPLASNGSGVPYSVAISSPLELTIDVMALCIALGLGFSSMIYQLWRLRHD